MSLRGTKHEVLQDPGSIKILPYQIIEISLILNYEYSRFQVFKISIFNIFVCCHGVGQDTYV